jgi:hypothetical protein
MKSSIFWDTRPSISLKVNRRFGGTCRLNIQGQRKRQARNQREAGNKTLDWLAYRCYTRREKEISAECRDMKRWQWQRSSQYCHHVKEVLRKPTIQLPTVSRSNQQKRWIVITYLGRLRYATPAVSMVTGTNESSVLTPQFLILATVKKNKCDCSKLLSKKVR